MATDSHQAPRAPAKRAGLVLSNKLLNVIVNTKQSLLVAALAGVCGCRAGMNHQVTADAASSAAAQAASLQGKPAALKKTDAAQAAPPLAVEAAPRLAFTLTEMKERTGGEFGLAVPMLLLTIKNLDGPVEVPPPGVDLILSLRLRLRRGEHSELRHVTLLRPWQVELAPLSLGEEIRQGLSPLSVERRDAPLAPGRYRVAACVPPHSEATYPSLFTSKFGGTCSDEIEIEVKRRR